MVRKCMEIGSAFFWIQNGRWWNEVERMLREVIWLLLIRFVVWKMWFFLQRGSCLLLARKYSLAMVWHCLIVFWGNKFLQPWSPESFSKASVCYLTKLSNLRMTYPTASSRDGGIPAHLGGLPHCQSPKTVGWLGSWQAFGRFFFEGRDGGKPMRVDR